MTTSSPDAQLTHVGVLVDDMKAMTSFYTDVIGMFIVDEGEHLDRYLTFLSRSPYEHHQLVLITGRHAPADVRLLGQVSFRVPGLTELRAFHARAAKAGAAGLEARNHGNSWSIYFADPEGNKIEMYCTTPFHARQPWRVALDLSLTDEEIVTETQRVIAAEAEWMPVEQWRTGIAARMGQTLPEQRPYRSIWTHLREVPFTQGFLDVDGVRTRYAEAGPKDAPVVMMLHGTGGHWETFAANLGPYSQHYRCIALDMVGNGFSDKPDTDYEVAVYVQHVRAAMAAMGVERASFIGVSLGSWVAARLAHDHPEQVQALIFLATAGLIATRTNMDRIRAERTKAVNDPSWASISAMFEHLIADPANRIDDLVALRQAVYGLPEMKTAIDHILILQDPEVRDRNLLSEAEWSAITAPAFVVASGKDHNEYANTSRRVAALMPNARLFEMPAVRHWPHFEDPATFNDASLAFLGEVLQ